MISISATLIPPATATKMMLPHWSFLHSCSWRVTDLCRRFTSALRAGSLVSCHCLLNRFLQAYLLLNTSRHRWPRVCTRSTLGSGHLEGPTYGTGQTPDTRVNDCLICSFRVERNDIVQACLELGPIGPFEVWTVQGVEKVLSTRGIDQYV
jgi:hypothetical protein